MDIRHEEKRFEDVEGVLDLACLCVNADKTRVYEIDVIYFVSGSEDDGAFGDFFGRKLGKELFDLRVFGFCHTLAIISIGSKKMSDHKL